MQQKSVNNAAMESKAYSALKQIEKTSALYADHIYCNQPQLLENENNKKETINNLKSMLILHLEVVKEQADQLLNKDKQIAKLKQENDELKQRLEKYELQQRHHRSSQAKRMSKGIKTLPSNENENKSTRCSDIECFETPTKRRKKSQNNNEQTPVKHSSPLPPPPPVVVVETPAHDVQEPIPEPHETPKKGPRNSFITTSSDYILCDWQKSEAERDADVEPLLRASLEIPSWQTKDRAYQCTYSDAGNTEDMSDDAFLKRHAKYETDERRRKKWDVQRLREQKQVERLKKRYQKDEYDEKDQKSEHKSITSFYPSADNIKYIQIVDELPVLAFGEPIPSLPDVDFALAWMISNAEPDSPTATCFTKTRFFSKKK